jgi:hypothetical protein
MNNNYYKKYIKYKTKYINLQSGGIAMQTMPDLHTETMDPSRSVMNGSLKQPQEIPQTEKTTTVISQQDSLLRDSLLQELASLKSQVKDMKKNPVVEDSINLISELIYNKTPMDLDSDGNTVVGP